MDPLSTSVRPDAGALGSIGVAFERARADLAEEGLNCVDRVNAAWSRLRHLGSADLPPSLSSEWDSVSERANLLALPAVVPHSLARMDEAGDVGSILLCLNWLVRYEATLEAMA